jgi:hypothetical protein
LFLYLLAMCTIEGSYINPVPFTAIPLLGSMVNRLMGPCLTVKPVGEPDARNPRVRFDERGWETERCRMAQATAPILLGVLVLARKAVQPFMIRRMISDGMLPAQHHCEGAPWIICLHDLNCKDVCTEAERWRSRCPLSHDPRQRSLDL